MIRDISLVLLVFFHLWAISAHGSVADSIAWTSEQIAIVQNRNSNESRLIAKYYSELRSISPQRFITLSTTEDETISREDFLRDVLHPLRLALQRPGMETVKCLVTTRGLPLKIRHHEAKEPKSERAFATTAASVASELMNARRSFTLHAGWKRRDPGVPDSLELMVFRLDGPGVVQIREYLESGIEREKKGLKGNFCIDARGLQNDGGYARYDKALQRLGERLSGRLPHLRVLFDATPELMQKGSCPQTALYVGWYSMAKYVDAFEWEPGSVGYHLASLEANTFKQKGAQNWCKRMIEEGAAMVIGPVQEPFLTAFPMPDAFFPLLLSGRITMGQVLALTLPHSSWMMVPVGDPLYRPFQSNPQMSWREAMAWYRGTGLPNPLNSPRDSTTEKKPSASKSSPSPTNRAKEP